MGKLVVIGLDCADPKLIFREMIDDLPNIRSLMRESTYGRMKSIIPPITVPAWMCMMTGKDPGELGIYGFRNRKDYSYDSLSFANSRMVKYPKVWDRLGMKGLISILLGIPLTYPPKPIRGCLISGFLAPDTESDYTYPKELKEEIRSWVGGYMLDVPDFRTDDKDRVIRDIYSMTDKRFEVAKRLITGKKWDFFMMVEMGLDRIYHGFWAYHDSGHPKHDPNSPYRDVIREYTAYLDGKIGEILDLIPDETRVIIISDHGVQRMSGGISINEWFIRNGYLTLKEYPKEPIRMGDLIRKGMVDWSKTIAWGEGGYYGRVFLNVKGREPEGIVPQEEYEKVRDEIKSAIEGITDEFGTPLGTVVYKPQEIYRTVRNIPPDLIVYFGGLKWRSLGTVGSGKIHHHENDTGPDDANHAQYGMWLMTGGKGEEREIDILGVHDLIMSVVN
ncbi:TPA: phosphodiesterase [Candidatus Poribacteria bacterium]|nr:phosphodiesterase [Candidatus Poribacteria bacterium]HEX29396.1 phosphodiesterase [Candidatus Poribacteria bacterium]